MNSILNSFIILTIIITFSSSCTGYRFKYTRNPLAQYHIKTLSIPMFLNKSSVPNVAGAVTKEISLLMSEFSDLRVYPGDFMESDAVLIGIIDSPDLLREAAGSSGDTAIEGGAGWNIGPRKKFHVPNTTHINLTVRLVLIKDPTHHDVQVFLSSVGKFLYRHPKIIFNQVLPMNSSFSRVVLDNEGSDSGGVVNFTQNKGAMEKSIVDSAKGVANSFKELILYAY